MGLFDIFNWKKERQQLLIQNAVLQRKQQELNSELESTRKENADFDERCKAYDERCKAYQDQKVVMQGQIQSLQYELAAVSPEQQALAEKARKEYQKTVNATQKVKALYDRYKYAIDCCRGRQDDEMPDVTVDDILSPVFVVDLNCISMKDLRSKYRANEREMQQCFVNYSAGYTQKSNIALYQLMVIAMQSELQLAVASLKYGKLDDAIEKVKQVTKRYYEVAVSGNKAISPKLQRFIAEIEYLFIEAVKIEYEYYTKKEQAKEEQRAIREQMKQEAEERKALEEERRKVEREESKFVTQIEQLQEKAASCSDDSEMEKLRARIAELEEQRAKVQEKKEQIANLQNGKAGHVYIISNLGSFGDDVFKIGMTRRFEPLERIKELGSASVPFDFDVHSLIFSEDAPALENALHKCFNQQRVNKVNLRKEFFRVSIDELEQAVNQYDPTAEFRRTMAAEQYYQSISRDTVVQEIEDNTDAE